MSTDELIELAIKVPGFLLRFDGKREPSTEHSWGGVPCLDWTGAVNDYGYGVVGIPSKVSKKRRFAYVHRLEWVRWNGPVPEGLEMRHRCHRGCCTELAHLTVGTHRQNVEDMMAAGRNRNRSTGPLPENR